jgi:hypothetical protein
MERTRQALAATMDMVGYTVKSLARSIVSPKTGRPLGTDTVGDIVNKDVSYAMSGATKAIWDKLDEAKAAQDDAIDEVLALCDAMREAIPDDEPPVVELRYWTSEREYLESSTDARLGAAGDWRMANANSRRLAAILESEGVTVEWVGAPIPRG